jgi:hypothetical protein
MAELPEFYEFEFTVKGRYRIKRDELNFLYETEDLQEAAAIDEQNLRDDPGTLDFFMSGDVEFEVKPVTKS